MSLIMIDSGGNPFIQSKAPAGGYSNLSFRGQSFTDDLNLGQTSLGGVVELKPGKGFFANWWGPGAQNANPPLGTIFQKDGSGDTFLKVSGGSWTSGGEPAFLGGFRFQPGPLNASAPAGQIWSSGNSFIQINTDDGIRYRNRNYSGSGIYEFMRQYSNSWIIGGTDAVYNTAYPLVLIRGNVIGGDGITGTGAMVLQLGGNSSVTRYPVVTFFNNNNGTYSQQGRFEINDTSIQLVSSSDYRLKKDVTQISNGVDMVKALKPCYFRRSDIPDSPQIAGFLAHELAEVLPRAVVGTKDQVDADGRPALQSIDAKKIIPLLAAALKSIRKDVQIMQAHLQTQKG